MEPCKWFPGVILCQLDRSKAGEVPGLAVEVVCGGQSEPPSAPNVAPCCHGTQASWRMLAVSDCVPRVLAGKGEIPALWLEGNPLTLDRQKSHMAVSIRHSTTLAAGSGLSRGIVSQGSTE